MDDTEFSYYLQQLQSATPEDAYFAFLTHVDAADISKLIAAFLCRIR